jgi:hypothetical protein
MLDQLPHSVIPHLLSCCPHPLREPPPHLRRQLIQQTPPAPRPAQHRKRYPLIRRSVCQQLLARPQIP